jgi:hypothetical protein
VSTVALDRANAEVHLLGDLAVRVAERYQLQNLYLAVGKAIRRARCVRRCGGHLRAKLGVEVCLTASGGSHGVDQLGVGRLLEDVAGRPGAHRLVREGGIVLHGQHDDSCVR